jgi:hypothetical protein
MHDGGGLAEDAKKLEGTTVPRPWRRIGRSPSWGSRAGAACMWWRTGRKPELRISCYGSLHVVGTGRWWPHRCAQRSRAGDAMEAPNLATLPAAMRISGGICAAAWLMDTGSCLFESHIWIYTINNAAYTCNSEQDTFSFLEKKCEKRIRIGGKFEHIQGASWQIHYF